VNFAGQMRTVAAAMAKPNGDSGGGGLFIELRRWKGDWRARGGPFGRGGRLEDRGPCYTLPERDSPEYCSSPHF
jgi:hypothetical protein